MRKRKKHILWMIYEQMYAKIYIWLRLYIINIERIHVIYYLCTDTLSIVLLVTKANINFFVLLYILILFASIQFHGTWNADANCILPDKDSLTTTPIAFYKNHCAIINMEYFILHSCNRIDFVYSIHNICTINVSAM